MTSAVVWSSDDAEPAAESQAVASQGIAPRGMLQLGQCSAAKRLRMESLLQAATSRMSGKSPRRGESRGGQRNELEASRNPASVASAMSAVDERNERGGERPEPEW